MRERNDRDETKCATAAVGGFSGRGPSRKFSPPRARKRAAVARDARFRASRFTGGGF
jgi:hypothetical protein